MDGQGLRQVLYNALAERCSLEDLEHICFRLGLDWEKLSGDNKFAKVRALILYYERRDALDKLVKAIREARPDIDLEAMTADYASVPHQVPLPPADFVGREAELEDLCAAVETQGAIITGVQGLGGIGKTTLAYKLVERLRPKYPDGDLLVELNGVEPDQALRPERVIEKILHTYQPEAKLPETLGELKNLYRTALHGKRVLILLDNAEGQEQVAPLLPPPPGCLVIITSRKHFVIEAMHPVNLEALPLADAVKLILEIAPRVGKEGAEKLAKACGRLPMALRLLAGLLRKRPGLQLEDLLRRLKDEHRVFGVPEMEKVEASISLSYRMLSSSLQEKWRKLAVFAGDFDREAAAWVWGMITDETSNEQEEQARDLVQDELDELCEYSLVDGSTETNRYILHDLARAYALQRMAAEEEYQVHYIHALYYLNILVSANRLYLKGGDYIMQGLALFDRERREIEGGQNWVAGASEDQLERLALCNTYPGVAVFIMDLRQHPRESITWLGAALHAAQQLSEKQLEGIHLGNLGLAYADLGESQRAIEYYERQLAITREICDRRGESNALDNLGVAYIALGMARKAIENLEQALSIDCEISNLRGIGADLGDLGNAFADLGEARRAIDYYEQALIIARQLGNRRGEGEILSNLGLAYVDLGETQRAIEYFEKAWGIAQQIEDHRGEGRALGSLARAYSIMGNAKWAIPYFEKFLMVACDIGDRRGEGSALGNLGLAYTSLGNMQQAINCFEHALLIEREIGDKRAEGAILGNMGVVYKNLGEIQRAIGFYEQQFVIANEVCDRRGKANACWNQGLLYESQGALARAVEQMQVLVNFEREVGHADAEKHAERMDEIRRRIEEAGAGAPDSSADN